MIIVTIIVTVSFTGRQAYFLKRNLSLDLSVLRKATGIFDFWDQTVKIVGSMDQESYQQLQMWLSEHFSLFVTPIISSKVVQISREKMSEKPHSIRLLKWFNFSQSGSRENNRKAFEGASMEPTKRIVCWSKTMKIRECSGKKFKVRSLFWIYGSDKSTLLGGTYPYNGQQEVPYPEGLIYFWKWM